MTDWNVIIRKKPKADDKRPLWRRLLSSLRPDIRFGKKGITYIGLKGKVDF